jgi:hypothetical protein
MAYHVPIEASEPGARIVANGQDIGATPLTLKIFGDPDGTFHDFGSSEYIIQALPLTTNQYAQVRMFGTGHMFGPEDRIPQRIYFDMNQPAPAYPTYAAPAYGPPAYYGYPYHYGYYGPSVYIGPRPYYGPSFHFGFSHRFHGSRAWRHR